MTDRHAVSNPTRKDFLAAVATFAIAGTSGAPRLIAAAFAATNAEDVLIVEFSADAVRTGASRVPKIVKSDAEWRKQLSPLAYDVTRHAGTERSFTGAYWDLHQTGVFRCVCCDTALFSSGHKFDSGTGWPSFFKPIAAENVVGPRAQSPGADPTEVTCHRCDAHLGDIYDDGPRPTGLRYCIDSIALRFVKAN